VLVNGIRLVDAPRERPEVDLRNRSLEHCEPIPCPGDVILTRPVDKLDNARLDGRDLHRVGRRHVAPAEPARLGLQVDLMAYALGIERLETEVRARSARARARREPPEEPTQHSHAIRGKGIQEYSHGPEAISAPPRNRRPCGRYPR